MKMKPMRLHLVLKHRYYEAIASGSKKIEYRKNTAYWKKRILDKWNPNGGNIVTFHKGYTNITMVFHVEALGSGIYYIALFLGEQILGD